MNNQSQGNYHNYNNQGYRPHPSIEQGHDQGSSYNAMPKKNLYEKKRKLEETLAQFMKVSLSNHKSTEASIKSLEFQVRQHANKLAERNTKYFSATIVENPKCGSFKLVGDLLISYHTSS